MELDEGKELSAMLEACRRVLPNVEGRDHALAAAIRDTCRAIEARLVELGVRFDSVFAKTH